jgi:hypothetical protein
MSHYHAVVWIDHQNATAWHFSLIGPAQTKQEFAVYLRDKYPPLGKAIVAVESADHPTDAQVLDYARRHFPTLDRMQ